MQFNREILKTKSVDELRAILVSKGIDYHPRHKAETLIDMIASLDFTIQPSDRTNKKPEPKQKDEIVKLTEAEIVTALQPFIAKGLNVTTDQDCWYMSCRGREDSGNLHMPLETLKRIATHVVRGRLTTSGIEMGAA